MCGRLSSAGDQMAPAPQRGGWMHAKLFRAVGAAAAAGALAVSPVAGQAALAAPGPVAVPCSAAALAAALAGATGGETLSLAPMCHYQLTEALPQGGLQLPVHGNGATLERRTP